MHELGVFSIKDIFNHWNIEQKGFCSIFLFFEEHYVSSRHRQSTS